MLQIIDVTVSQSFLLSYGQIDCNNFSAVSLVLKAVGKMTCSS